MVRPCHGQELAILLKSLGLDSPHHKAVQGAKSTLGGIVTALS